MRRFRRLCDQHLDRIYTFACYFLGNREDAEDVTQEVLIRLWERGREIEEADLPAWITRVTRNACIDALRRRPRAGSTGDDAFEHIASPAPGPDAEVEAAEFQQRLERALLRLPESHRAIVVLREIQGLKYEEIGEALRLPLNTVKVYLHRGRRELRELLRENQEND